ncbi:hypothetical protein H0H93_002051 [Arthromyces matolae]|nr:hypothetical protein H0H93_002051 [Arthromyces matolae]
MSAFSRLQLAAALLEYDNDPDDPHIRNRSAQESAIFLPFRHLEINRTHKNDYLGVPLPGDGTTATARSLKSNSVVDHQSRASISTLHNPFRQDDHFGEEEGVVEEELEVDLSSWGLDAFIPKDKSSKGKGKAKLNEPPLHSMSSVSTHQPLTNHESVVSGPRRALGASRSMSVGGNLEYFSMEGEKFPTRMDDSNRRRSFASPVDVQGIQLSDVIPRRRASTYSAYPPPNAPHALAVPFPTVLAHPVSSELNDVGDTRPSSLGSRLESSAVHERARSVASADSRLMLRQVAEEPDGRQRTMSNATMATILLAEDNPFAIRPPSRASRFDPKAAAHARTTSNASLGTRLLDDGVSVHTSQAFDGDRRYSTTLELLRPKVLVMPSPLQPTTSAPPPTNEKLRDGFELSTDGPPLPPGARSSRRLSSVLSPMEVPSLASNSFTPNPLSSLSLSQMTFRNTLRIDGQRDSYVNTELPRATTDGEQAQFEPDVDEIPIVAVTDADEPFKTNRPAGKLFGKSLIDDLENRKAQMRSKQRVFSGDDRPSMMARTSTQRSSTLIDPATLQSRPASQHLHSFGPPASQQALGRRNSVKPLLNFDDETNSRLPHGRSVFGVDTLWEREMVKLKEIEAREKQEEDEREIRDATEGAKKKKKRKDRSKASRPRPESGTFSPNTEPKVSVEPPVLPDIPRAVKKPAPRSTDDASDSDDSEIAATAGQRKKAPESNWQASSDEEDHAPRRTTGTGPRYPTQLRQQRAEDAPLSTIRKPNHLSADSDDERPLSSLLQSKQSKLLDINFDNLRRSEDDDDDKPLGLRISRVAPSLRARDLAEDDDDRPLAFHPDQQRRSEFQMAAAHQQQQFMLQAQMQNSMYFTPPAMMASPFYGPTMMPMMMQPPIPMPSPPPVHDQAKYNRVDNWRRDVAIEGDSA